MTKQEYTFCSCNLSKLKPNSLIGIFGTGILGNCAINLFIILPNSVCASVFRLSDVNVLRTVFSIPVRRPVISLIAGLGKSVHLSSTTCKGTLRERARRIGCLGSVRAPSGSESFSCDS